MTFRVLNGNVNLPTYLVTVVTVVTLVTVVTVATVVTEVTVMTVLCWFPVQAINILDIFYKILKFLGTSWATDLLDLIIGM